MLLALSGRTHHVLTAVVVVAAQRQLQVVVTTEVTFGMLDADAAARYVDTGEAMGKAGAYAIQGAAESFVTRLAGSHSGVMGLPLHEAAMLLRGFGLEAGYAPGAAKAVVGA